MSQVRTSGQLPGRHTGASEEIQEPTEASPQPALQEPRLQQPGGEHRRGGDVRAEGGSAGILSLRLLQARSRFRPQAINTLSLKTAKI